MLVSGIYSKANGDPPEGAEADRRNDIAFQAIWQERGLLVIYPDSVTDDWERQFLNNIAEKHYLKRAGK